MNFSETYRNMNAAIAPSPALAAETVAKTRRSARRLRPRRPALIAAVLALALCATPALAARTELGYQALYLVSPAAAQFFQPVQRSCTHGDVTMEVVAVRVEGSAAQAYITLTGDAVDETTDLYDSYSFHLPFDQTGRCERVGYDEATHTATFLCTVETMDGSPIPTGGKMTFSVGCFLSDKEEAENMVVDLNLADYAAEAVTAPVWRPGEAEDPDAYFCSGGSGTGGLELDSTPMLLPGDSLADPIADVSVTAAGYSDGLFHIQTELKNHLKTDAHCQLWLEDAAGNRLNALKRVYFTRSTGIGRKDYSETVFDISPAALSNCTLHGDFHASGQYTEGRWQVTFPLEDAGTL
nr:DUF4179 domain-containing protein [uncultured Oscillibacter sp.]